MVDIRRSLFVSKLMTRSVFCEVLHSEAIRRKRDSTHQDVAFFRRRFVAFGGQKW